MARAPIRPRLEPELLRPAASPVDSYVQPQRSTIHDLAEALAPLSAEVRGLINQRAESQREEDQKQAEADHFASNEMGYAEGVRSGRIPAHHSRTYMRTYKAAEGAALGRRLQAQYQRAWEAWEGRNAEDPDGSLHDAFFQNFLRANVGTEDPDILAGALPALRNLGATAAAADVKYRSDRAYLGSITAHAARVHQIIDDGDEAGLTSTTGTDYEGVFAATMAERARIVASGARPEDFDARMMEAFAAKAIEKRDAGLLGWFDQTVPGKDYTYGETPEGQAIRQSTLEKLETVRRQYVSDEHTRQTREDQAAKNAATRQVVELLAAGEPIPEELLVAGQRVDPTFRTRISEWRKNLQERTTDPEVLNAIYDDILAGRGVQAVVDAFNAGLIANPEDLTKLHTFAKGFGGAEGVYADTLGTPTARGILEAIDVRTKGSNRLGDPVSGLSNDGMAATRDFRRRIGRWLAANPNADYLEREEAVDQIGRAILDSISSPSIREQGGSYERPEGFTEPNPHADAAPWPGRPTPAQTEPQPEPEPQSSWKLTDPRTWFGGGESAGPPTQPDAPGDDIAAWLDSLSPAQRGAIEEGAQRDGVSVEDAARGLLRQMGGESADAGNGPATYQPMAFGGAAAPRPEDGPDARNVSLTPEQASAFLDEALAANTIDTKPGSAFIANDPTASRLLNLIGQHEAAGNYNAVYGRAGSKRDLSALTLDQILGQQREARRRGAASTAIGRYQFIYRTLSGLKSELGLSGRERFTPELQDRLAMQLLERRGYSAFRAGRITQRQFALRLSMEWASLANPNTGRSFYAGDGLNASSASARDVYRALGLSV